MTQQDYVSGSWQKLGPECAPGSLQELAEHAYPYEPYCNPQHHVCTNETDTCSRKAVDIASWQWVPDKCNLHHFSAEQLDRKLAGRKVRLPECMLSSPPVQLACLVSIAHLRSVKGTFIWTMV